eukprot:15858_1
MTSNSEKTKYKRKWKKAPKILNNDKFVKATTGHEESNIEDITVWNLKLPPHTETKKYIPKKKKSFKPLIPISFYDQTSVVKKPNNEDISISNSKVSQCNQQSSPHTETKKYIGKKKKPFKPIIPKFNHQTSFVNQQSPYISKKKPTFTPTHAPMSNYQNRNVKKNRKKANRYVTKQNKNISSQNTSNDRNISKSVYNKKKTTHRTNNTQDAVLNKTFTKMHNGKYKCKECLKVTDYYSLALRHANTHNNEIRKHKCSYCNTTFKQKSQLNQHIRIHTGVQEYKCSKCGKAFTQSGTRNYHEDHCQSYY